MEREDDFYLDDDSVAGFQIVTFGSEVNSDSPLIDFASIAVVMSFLALVP
jgi:hypothetical protein